MFMTNIHNFKFANSSVIGEERLALIFVGKTFANCYCEVHSCQLAFAKYIIVCNFGLPCEGVSSL